MKSDFKQKIENEIIEFTKIIEDRGERAQRFEIGRLPGLISIDDSRPENIVLAAYIPHFGDTEVGHIFAGRKDEEDTFYITSLYVDSKYGENQIGSNLINETLKAIENYKPTYVYGNFDIKEGDFLKVKHLFKQCGFGVRKESDNSLAVMKLYLSYKKRKKGNGE